LTNRPTKLVFRSAFVAVGIIGILASLGFFGYNYREDFYVYFTNLSNYLCFGIMLAKFVFTVQGKDVPRTTLFQFLDFAAVLSILLTFYVYNFILAVDFHPSARFEISSMLYHVILPLMYAADRLVFGKETVSRWYFPLISALLPIVYGAFIFIRAAIPGIEKHTSVIYPYFFLNIKNLGTENVAKWLSVMLMVFIVAGYGLLITEHMIKAIARAISDKK